MTTVSSSETALLEEAVAELTSEECVVTLLKVLDNILTETSYTSKTRKLKLNNPVFSKRVARHEGGIEFLQACRFTKRDDDNVLELLPSAECKWWLWQARRTLYDQGEYALLLSDLPPSPITEPPKEEEVIKTQITHETNGMLCVPVGKPSVVVSKVTSEQNEQEVKKESKIALQIKEACAVSLETSNKESSSTVIGAVLEPKRPVADESEPSVNNGIEPSSKDKVSPGVALKPKGSYEFKQYINSADASASQASKMTQHRSVSKEEIGLETSHPLSPSSVVSPTLIVNTKRLDEVSLVVEEPVVSEASNETGSLQQNEMASDTVELDDDDLVIDSFFQTEDDNRSDVSVSTPGNTVAQKSSYELKATEESSSSDSSEKESSVATHERKKLSAATSTARTTRRHNLLRRAELVPPQDEMPQKHYDQMGWDSVKALIDDNSIVKELEACWGATCVVMVACSSLAADDLFSLPKNVDGEHSNSATPEVLSENKYQATFPAKGRPWIPLEVLYLLWRLILTDENDSMDAATVDDLCERMQQALVDSKLLETHSLAQTDKDDDISHVYWVRARQNQMVWCGVSLPLSQQKGVQWTAALALALQRDSRLWYSRYALPALFLAGFKDRTRIQVLLKNKDFVQSRLGMLGIIRGTQRHVKDCENYIQATKKEEATQDAWEAARAVALDACQTVAACLYRLGQALRKERDSFERKEVATALFTLGMTVGEWGDYEFEMQLYSKTLKLRRESGEHGNEMIADTLICMGACHQSQGDYSAAMSCYEEAQDMYRKSLGKTNVKVAKSLHNMGVIHCERSELDSAMQCFKSSLSIRKLQCKNETYDEHMADTLCWVGKVYSEQHLLDKALKYFVTARTAKEQIFGKETLEVAEILQNIAVIHDDKGEYDRSLVLYNKSLRFRKNILGDEHEDICELYTCIGNAYRSIGDSDMALVSFRRALNMRTNLTRSVKLDKSETMVLIDAHDDVVDALKEQLRAVSDPAPLRDELAGHLMKIGYHYESIDRYEKSIEFFDKCLKIRKLAGDSVQEGKVMNAIGIAHAKMQKYVDALSVFKEALEVRKEALGDSHIEVGETLHNMGNCAAKLNNWSDGLDYYEEALQIKRQILGRHHASVAQTLHNMGNILSKQGLDDAAMRYYQDALVLRKAIGADSIDVAFSLHSIAKVHRNKNELEDAIKNFNASLDIKRLKLEKGHISIAETLDQLGTIYVETGEPDEATLCFNGALRIYKTKLGNHINTAETYEALASISEKKGDHSKSIGYLCKALKVRSKIFGVEDVRVAETQFRIGKLHRSLGASHEALASFQQATRIRKKQMGRDDLIIADILTDAGELQLQIGQKHVALKCFSEALRIRRLLLGSAHESTGDSLVDMGDAYQADGEHQCAVESYKDALGVLAAARGENDLSVGTACHKLGLAYKSQKDLDSAIKCYKTCMSVQKSSLGADTMPVALVCHDLGVAYLESGKYAEAEDLLRESVEVKIKVSGEDDLSVAETVLYLGRVCIKLKSPDEALMYFEQARLIKQQHLGDDHLECTDTLRDIGCAHELNGDHKESLVCFKSCLRARRQKVGDDEMVAELLYSIGTVEQTMLDYDAALKNLAAALALFKALLGEESLSVAKTQYSIGLIYEAKGENQVAMRAHREAFRLRRTLLGSDHLKVAQSLDHISGLYLKESNKERALKGLQEALRIRTVVLGNEDIEVGTTLFGIGVVFAEIGSLDKAMECYTASLNIRKSKLGESSVEVAQTLHNMGTLHAKMGEYDEALEQWKSALKVYRDGGLGDEEHVVAITIGNINMAESLLEDQEKAEVEEREAVYN